MLREIAPGSADFRLFLDALKAERLPTDDIGEEGAIYFTWSDRAWGGLGIGSDGLLRSVVVAPELRGCGMGAALVKGLCQTAQSKHVRSLWLLTTSASGFFHRLGWREAARDQAPPVIARSRQFSELCPSSAALMVRALS